jgi:lipid-binding SYLF domain-containing protein
MHLDWRGVRQDDAPGAGEAPMAQAEREAPGRIPRIAVLAGPRPTHATVRDGFRIHVTPMKLKPKRKEKRAMKNVQRMPRRGMLLWCALALAVVLVAGPALDRAQAKTAAEIDASVKACLDRFYKQVKGGKEIAAKSKGMLVMPNVVKAGLVVGGEYGEGALRVGGKNAGYYNLASGSIGFQIGGEAKDFVILFMTEQALKQFQASKGWEVGLDGNIALVNVGGGERVDFTKLKDPIVAFVFDVKGLMADISLKGAKFSKIQPK